MATPHIILYDIEGTLGPVSFVKEVMFPLAARELPSFVRQNKDDLAQELQEVRQEISSMGEASLEAVIAALLSWIDEDRKASALKSIQGKIWQAAFSEGSLKGRVYPDAHQAIVSYAEQGVMQAIYSSGSVLAQKMYFGHSEYGDLTDFFSAHFDTKIGGKKESSSYEAIAQSLETEPAAILFFSDIIEELMAAKQAGLQTCHVVRPEDGTDNGGWQPSISSFNEWPVATQKIQ